MWFACIQRFLLVLTKFADVSRRRCVSYCTAIPHNHSLTYSKIQNDICELLLNFLAILKIVYIDYSCNLCASALRFWWLIFSLFPQFPKPTQEFQSELTMASSVLKFQSQDNGHEDGKHEPFDLIASSESRNIINLTPTNLSSLPNESFLRSAISLKDQVMKLIFTTSFLSLISSVCCSICILECVYLWNLEFNLLFIGFRLNSEQYCAGSGGYLENSRRRRRPYGSGGWSDGVFRRSWHGVYLLEVLRSHRKRAGFAIVRGDCGFVRHHCTCLAQVS